MPNSAVSLLSLLPPGASERPPHLLDATLTLAFFPYANARLTAGLQPPGVSCLVESLPTHVGTNNAVGYHTHTMHKHTYTPTLHTCLGYVLHTALLFDLFVNLFLLMYLHHGLRHQVAFFLSLSTQALAKGAGIILIRVLQRNRTNRRWTCKKINCRSWRI